MKMLDTTKCSVRFATFSDGERYPLLIDGRGVPLWYPTLFTTTQVRNASKAPNTMVAVLSAIRVLIAWAQSHDVDLESRFANRLFLNEQEVESLCRYAQTKSSEPEYQSQNVVRMKRRKESARSEVQISESRVSGNTRYIRISYMANYLDWLAIRLIERDAKLVDSGTLDHIKRMVKSLHMRRPQKARNSAVFARKGLTEARQELLLELVRRGSDKNPFSPDLQARNQLIVLLLYYLGLRAGELLALRISDFDLQQNTVLVARRHDNPDDPRTYQPVVKTADRRIPLAEPLVKTVFDYILHERGKIPAAKRHDFLFVTHQTGPFEGQPLSIKGLAKVFSEIQGAMPDELGDLTPHVLRHTANDRFSSLMDQKGAGQAEEEKLRSYLMGWKEGSGTASTYTRRHTETKAREAALKLQSKIRKDENG
jgi:integrase